MKTVEELFEEYAAARRHADIIRERYMKDPEYVAAEEAKYLAWNAWFNSSTTIFDTIS
jgi:hypothetical protein